MKILKYILIFTAVAYFGQRQYKFNSQLEWWTSHTSNVQRCQHWDLIIPMDIKIEETVGDYKNGRYAVALKEWKDRVAEDRKEACNESYKFHDLNPYMPFTDDYHKFRKETGLSSITGYLKDFFRKPKTATNEVWIENPKYTVKLKNHWYGGSDGECYIQYAEKIQGAPLPFLSRYLYTLSCVNDKSKAEGVGGFHATSTADNLEDL